MIKYWWIGQSRSRRNERKFHLTISETPTKILETLSNQEDPRELSRALERLSRLDTYENLATANIQGVGLHLVKLKHQYREDIQP